MQQVKGDQQQGNRPRRRSFSEKVGAIAKTAFMPKGRGKGGHGKPSDFVERPKFKALKEGEPVLNVDVDIGQGKKGNIKVCIGDDPFKLALDFCANHNLTNTDPDLDANGKFVGNFRQYEAENKYVKMVKDHIMKFIDTSTTKVGGVPVRKCVGKKGSLNWQKAAAVAAAKGAAPTTNQRAGEETEAKKDPFSVQPSIPQNKRMSSISTSEANSTSGIEPANKKNKTDKTPTGKGVKGAHEAGAAIAARAAAATASPAPSSTALSTSAKESPHATVSKPKSTSKPAPKPTPSKAAQFSTGSEDEGGIGALAIGAVIIGVAAIGFIMLRKKK